MCRGECEKIENLMIQIENKNAELKYWKSKAEDGLREVNRIKDTLIDRAFHCRCNGKRGVQV